jgi:hypothetical protein
MAYGVRSEEKDTAPVVALMDGSVYQGQYARNMREGQGKMEWKDGRSSYRGEWLARIRICDSGQDGYVGTHTGQEGCAGRVRRYGIRKR